MNSFSSLALLVVTMSAIYLIVDAFAAKFQHVLAAKKAHVKFLEDRIQAERKSLDEYVASLPADKTKAKAK